MPPGQSTSLGESLRQARHRIDGTDVEWLLAHVLGKPRSWLFAHADDPLPADVLAQFEALLVRREAGEPVAYLTGTRGFWTFDLAVTADTLIPRPETELLVEAALSKLPTGGAVRVADLGTGSGAIALAIASERPLAQLVATDRSEAALEVARGNAAVLGIGNIELRAGDWCAPLQGERFDLIASNPPYIAEDDAHLAQGDLRFEPRQALTPGGDGLASIRAIIAGASMHLRPNGWLLFEHGHDQGAAVRGLMLQVGYAAVETRQDLEGRDRVTLGQRTSPGNE